MFSWVTKDGLVRINVRQRRAWAWCGFIGHQIRRRDLVLDVGTKSVKVS